MGELKRRGRVWWIRYYKNGARQEESSYSKVKQTAIDLLKIREGDGAHGLPVTAKISRFRFAEAAADLVTDYRINERASIDELERRLAKHLTPYFGGRRMAGITTSDVRVYVAHRQAIGIVAARGARIGERIGDVSNAEINRELTILKRMFTLAMQADKILRRPHIPMLEERNTRTGFFDRDMLDRVQARLPESVQPVIEFAYITGWRIPSEVLPLEWRHIDFAAGEIRLDPETTKNRDGRVFPMTDDLRRILTSQDEARKALQKAGHIVPWVFFRMVAKGRRGPKAPRRIVQFTKAWKTACLEAGCPGRIPHDFRRSAIRNMVRRSVPERVAMQLAGHKTRSIFDRYHIVSEGDLRSAAAQLSNLTGTKKGQSPELSPGTESETTQIC